jgi:hypothetical protein
MHYNTPYISGFLLAQFVLSLSGAKDVAECVESL